MRNHIIEEARNYVEEGSKVEDKWRINKNGKVFGAVLGRLMDSMENQKTLQIIFKYVYDADKGTDTVKIFPQLIKGWGDSGIPFSINNMQTKKTFEEAFKRVSVEISEQDMDKIIKAHNNDSSTKMFDLLQRAFGNRVPFSYYMTSWLNDSIMTVEKQEYKTI